MRSSPIQLPVVPMALEFPGEEKAAEEGHASIPTLSTSTNTTNDKMSGPKRGQHRRHTVSKKVHVITKIGPHGEPLEPLTVIGVFSNQCRSLVWIGEKYQRTSRIKCGAM